MFCWTRHARTTQRTIKLKNFWGAFCLHRHCCFSSHISVFSSVLVKYHLTLSLPSERQLTLWSLFIVDYRVALFITAFDYRHCPSPWFLYDKVHLLNGEHVEYHQFCFPTLTIRNQFHLLYRTGGTSKCGIGIVIWRRPCQFCYSIFKPN